MAALCGYSFLSHDERGLYAGLASALDAAGIPYERERTIGPKSRVDFYLPTSRLAVEVKVQGSEAAIFRQLTRYASCGDVDGILLVTTRGALTRIPTTIANKPARALRIAGPFG